MASPQFPAGEYIAPDCLTDDLKTELLERLAAVPQRVRTAIDGLSACQLDTLYRNWSIRQIVHHLADSHINCYVRFKWALTEDTPHIKSYDETRWSDCADAKTLPPECSLVILEGVHSRWVQLIQILNEAEMQRGFFHPELDRVVTLAEALPSYVWHADHHLAQIAWLREANGWN